MQPRERCVNLDWLEVYCHEPVDQPHTAEYFRSCGLFVRERDYGTRIYKEMFVIEDEHGDPFVEVRRAPKSVAGEGGILDATSTHLRLVNRYCYFDHAAMLFESFLAQHHYTDIRISRVDVCYDFELFDSGDKPADFVRRFMKGRYAKINQANIHSHGSDRWDGRTWNSISWGKPTSQISTKLYLKTLELKEAKDKPYIRQAWFESHLVDDPIYLTKFNDHGETYQPDIWRIEFSIKSMREGWYTIEENGNQKQKHSFRNTLSVYRDRESIWKVWASLSQHYFRFKKYEKDKRKDLCEDKTLFKLDSDFTSYQVARIASATPSSFALDSLRRKLSEYRAYHYDEKLRDACDIILNAITDDNIVSDLGSPVTRDEILALRLAINSRRTPQEILQTLIEHHDEIF